ncbi:MAG TPA: thioesterase family protein [Pseudonocardia sp.]
MKSAQSVAGASAGSRPFSDALPSSPDGPGVYQARLGADWVVGGGKIHGGVMLAVVTSAALAELTERSGVPDLDPLAVSADFLRAPEQGDVRITTEVVKIGRTASVIRADLHQDDRLVLSTSITAGRLPDDEPVWSDLPSMAVEPPDGVLATALNDANPSPLARSCDIRIDPTSYRRDGTGDPVMRGWVRPKGEEPDILFALFAGDVLPPVVFNVGRSGWAPTVQLTALLRARPAPGWLRAEVRSRVIAGNWFDEDATVLDSAGRLVCQARQLALAPLR